MLLHPIRRVLDENGIGKFQKNIDTGKIMALHNAKWSVEKISTEMGVPVEIIRDVINRH